MRASSVEIEVNEIGLEESMMALGKRHCAGFTKAGFDFVASRGQMEKPRRGFADYRGRIPSVYSCHQVHGLYSKQTVCDRQQFD